MPFLVDLPTKIPSQYTQQVVEEQSNTRVTPESKPKRPEPKQTPTPTPTELIRVCNEIWSYSRLVSGWDGEGSAPISKPVIFNALSFISSLGSFLELIDEDYIYPTADNTIVIDFQNKMNDLTSVEIGKSTVGYFFETQGHVEEFNSETFVGMQQLPPKVAGAIRKVWKRHKQQDSNS